MINAGKTPMDSATKKGQEAALDGQPEASCPYKDKRQDSGKLTFSRAWRNAWIAGYRSVKSERLSGLSTKNGDNSVININITNHAKGLLD